MMVPLLVFVAFGVWRWYENQTPGVMTNERKAVYHFAMREEREPQKIAYWANWFEKQGLDGQAKALRNRLNIPKISGEGREIRQTLVRKALSSDNVAGIHGLADLYECQGYGATAQLLKDYAHGLNWATQVPECEFSGESESPIFQYEPQGDSIQLTAQSALDYRNGHSQVVQAVQSYAARSVQETARRCIVWAPDGSLLYELKPVKV